MARENQLATSMMQGAVEPRCRGYAATAQHRAAKPHKQTEEPAAVRALRQLSSADTPDTARLCALLTLVCDK